MMTITSAVPNHISSKRMGIVVGTFVCAVAAGILAESWAPIGAFFLVLVLVGKNSEDDAGISNMERAEAEAELREIMFGAQPSLDEEVSVQRSSMANGPR